MITTKRLIWAGAATDPSGYGEATRNYVCGLGRYADLQVKLSPRYFWHGPAADLGKCLPELMRLQRNDFDRHEPYIYVQHLTPENYRLGAGGCKYHIGMTTFETTSVPTHWKPEMRQMDELWTFSRWGAKVFAEQGINRPITVIPHGVDVVRFRPGLEPLCGVRYTGEIGEYNGHVMPDKYLFGSCFDWTERKNPRALLKAFFTHFKKTDNVALLLKVFYQYPVQLSQEHVKQYIESLKVELGVTDTAPVLLINGIMPSDLLPRFYNTIDCYVLPSRGEGWGLTYSEAMACALPTIAVNWSAHTEFMNDTNSLLVKNYTLRQITPEQAGPQKHYTGHQWADCDVEELGTKMRWAYEHPSEADALGQVARETMRTKFTWQKAVAIAKHRLDELYANL